VLNPLFHPGWYMAVLIVTTMVWASLAALVGLLRLRDGYKPARFFVLVFALVSVSSAVSALDSLGVTDVIEHHYLVTMVVQSIDMGLLALGLADRINVSQALREEALQKAVDVEQRAAATERQASEKLQQALTLSERESEKKSGFLRMVSHELRTPLHTIISAIEQWHGAVDPAARRELIDCLGYGATRLRTQVDNLVLYAETDAEKIEINPSQFELRQLIDRVIDKTRPQSGDRVHFRLECSAQLPRLCVGDSYLIEHMLRTVLDNAFKYTTCGQVRLGVQWEAADSRLNIELNDTGCGMTPAQLDHVYNDFVQVSRGLNRSSEGLGLGLTVCYRLAAILGADLRIDSEPGVGTQVSISLPLQAVDTRLALVDDAAAPGAHAGCRLLLVEDNDVNAMVIARVLTRLGHQVERAVNGQEAVERAIASRFALILMDIQMPVMDGITAARWIRRRGVDTPIVAISANSDMSVRKRCGELGISDFLVKPIAQVDLQRVVARLLRGAGERAS
jgi:signal transduction histidine kinase/ActR/RegA family two-component response regulator